MSRERARRRAQREAAEALVRARRERMELRRARRRALSSRLRRLFPPRRRRAWLLGRRSPGQRAAIAGVAIGLLWTVWYLVEPWPLRIAFSLLVVIALPLFVVVAFDRRG